MEIQFAMAPPISFPERLLFLGIGFLSGRLLTFRPRQESPSRRRIVIVSLFVIAFLTLDVSTRGQGIFELLGGFICGGLFYIPSRNRGQKWMWKKGWLSAVCLFTGPAVAFLCWKLKLSSGDFEVDLFIGSVWGVIVALIVAVVNRGPVEQPSPNEPEFTPSPKMKINT
jgi:hypothetical protein